MIYFWEVEESALIYYRTKNNHVVGVNYLPKPNVKYKPDYNYPTKLNISFNLLECYLMNVSYTSEQDPDY